MSTSTSRQIAITEYTRRDRHLVSDILFRNYNVHTHIDWQEAEKWLETPDAIIRLAWQYGRLIGVLAAAPPLGGTTWLRIAGISDNADAARVFDILWNAVHKELITRQIHLVAVLMIRDWLIPLITPHGFTCREEVITLRRADQPPLVGESLPGLTIRATQPTDLVTITQVDQAAFEPPWQLTGDEVREAARVSAYCAVALRNEQIVGYQASTMYFDGSHLARLAVSPQAQGTGVGAALLGDVIRRFSRRGVVSMTVNTQLSNTRSQHLYERFGFQRNGYDIPVWMVNL
ncbi:MAG: GNAT family N-acetyltransferase [Anaerolinea sp.]|nr:GNAT family N-acetyltransferase [Anaerolinea sp.]